MANIMMHRIAAVLDQTILTMTSQYEQLQDSWEIGRFNKDESPFAFHPGERSFHLELSRFHQQHSTQQDLLP